MGHFNLTELPLSCVSWQVEKDREMLESLMGKEIRCMAYPCGGVNNNDAVAETIKATTKIRFARTITSTYSFDLQENLFRFNPTIHFRDKRLFDLVKEFLELKTDEPKLFYIWGHTYQLGVDMSWADFEEVCKRLASVKGLVFETNKDALLKD
jgi:hypothetical protein